MDYSEEYIAMSDTPYIQEDENGDKIIVVFGDYFIKRDVLARAKENKAKVLPVELLFDYRVQGLISLSKSREAYDLNYIRLLRQGQLQEMIDWDGSFFVQIGKNPLYDKFYMSMVVYGLGKKIIWTSDYWVRSFEQLWLCFVMYRNNGVKWENKEWRPIK